MTHDVKIKLAPGDITPVEFGDLDQFAIEARLHQDVPQGPDDAGSTPDQDGRRVVALDGAVVRRTVGAGQYWQAEMTKQRPSSAIVRMVGSQVSRSSTVGAQ